MNLFLLIVYSLWLLSHSASCDSISEQSDGQVTVVPNSAVSTPKGKTLQEGKFTSSIEIQATASTAPATSRSNTQMNTATNAASAITLPSRSSKPDPDSAIEGSIVTVSSGQSLRPTPSIRSTALIGTSEGARTTASDDGGLSANRNTHVTSPVSIPSVMAPGANIGTSPTTANTILSAGPGSDLGLDMTLGTSKDYKSTIPSSTATLVAASQSRDLPKSIISATDQVVTANPSSPVVTSSSGASSIKTSPGGPRVTLGNNGLSYGSSGIRSVSTSSAVMLPGPLSESSRPANSLSSHATVVTSVVGNSTVIQTFVPTEFSSLISITVPRLVPTTITIGSMVSVLSMTVGPGGMAWMIPSHTAGGPILTPPADPPTALPNILTSSTVSQQIPLPAQASTSTSPGAAALLPLGQVTSHSKDPNSVTEAPLTTISTNTSPVVILSLTTGVTEDGHRDDHGHPKPIFWHPHCFLFCGSGCDACGIQLDLGPGIYPPGAIKPPPGFNRDSMPAITVHQDGTPEYSTNSSPSSRTDARSISSTTSGLSSSSQSTSSRTSSSGSHPTIIPSEFVYTPISRVQSPVLRSLATAINLAWSSELQGLGALSSTRSVVTSSTAQQPLGPPFPSPSCLPAADGGFDIDTAVKHLEEFCTAENGSISAGSQPISKTYNGGHNDTIRFTLSWDGSGICPQSQSPNQNGGRDCNTIFHNIISGCPNDPSFQNGGSITWNCGYWFLGFDTGKPDMAPLPRTTDKSVPSPSGPAGVSTTPTSSTSSSVASPISGPHPPISADGAKPLGPTSAVTLPATSSSPAAKHESGPRIAAPGAKPPR